MSRYKQIKFIGIIKKFFSENFPNRKDNLKQLIIKIAFLLSIVGILYGGIHFTLYYSHSIAQQKLMNSDKQIFDNNSLEEAANLLHKQNNDYRAWLSMDDTPLSNPVYKTHNNSFYMTRNSLKKNSRYGSLCIDFRNNLSDKNTVIYGNSAENGLMFGTLTNLRELNFYKKHSVITLSHSNKETNYKIFALFVLNTSKEQDNGNIYELYKKDFLSENGFDEWINDAKERSLIDTNEDVEFNDKILTLVTDCEDFEDARLVVMARSERKDETLKNANISATLNPNPKYPKIWYDERNITYPFENFKNKD